MSQPRRTILQDMQAALFLTGALTLARLAYVAWLCPYSLVEDEANYWVWSTHLDWSYYTKGPGIAWAIYLATSLLGESEASIRLVAVLANAVTTVCVAAMAALVVSASCPSKPGGAEQSAETLDPRHDGARGEPTAARAALFAAAAVQLSPIFQGTAIFSTIDGPYAACWAAACLAALVALTRGGRWAWPACGAAIGIGFLFKYTILLLLPGLLLFAVLARRRLVLDRAWRAWMVTGALLMLAGSAPVVIWNQRHDWATVAHLLGHLGVKGGDMPVASSAEGADGGSPALAPSGAQRRGSSYKPEWTLTFIGSQFGMVGPLLVLGGCAAIARFRVRPGSWDRSRDRAPGGEEAPSDSPARRPLRELASRDPTGTLFLACGTAPILVFYLGVSFIAEPEGNWAMGGYVTLLALAGCAAAAGMAEFGRQVRAWRAIPEPRPKLGVTRRKPETFVQVLWHTSVIYGVLAGLVMLRLDWVIAAARPIVAAVGPSLGIKPEKVFSGRARNMFDAPRMGLNAYGHAFYHLKATTGLEPFYVAQHYGTAAVLTYYIPGQPLVYCSSSRMGGRPTPWDYWPEANLDDPSLLGRPAVILGARIEQWEPMFERVTPVDTPTGRLEGENKNGRLAFLGYGYKGWPKPPPP